LSIMNRGNSGRVLYRTKRGNRLKDASGSEGASEKKAGMVDLK